jgi:hypothetical protein
MPNGVGLRANEISMTVLADRGHGLRANETSLRISTSLGISIN